MTLSYLFGGTALVAGAASHQQLRLMTPGKYPPGSTSATPWQLSSPAAAANFSGLCFLTGVNIGRLHTGPTPIGLVYAAVGGTSISRWMPSAADTACGTAGFSGVDFAAHIAAPELPHMAIKAVVWYQVPGDCSQKHR